MKVRYLLERGRTRNSSGDRPAAVALFKEALASCRTDTLPGADFYRVDALHMLGIAAPAAEQLDWNLKALAAAEASSERAARDWAASLHNNIGWTYFDRGDTRPRSTLGESAAAARSAGQPGQHPHRQVDDRARVSATGRLDDAKEIQLELVEETEKRSGEPDGYVYEELAESIAVAKGCRGPGRQGARAAQGRRDMKANEAARLARLPTSRRASRRESRQAARDLRAAPREQPESDDRARVLDTVRAAGRGGALRAGDRQGRQQGDRTAFPDANTPAAIAKLGVEG